MADLDTLMVLGEIFLAFAGFTGIVAVLGQRSEGKWRPVDVVRFQMLLEGSLAGLLFAITPLGLYYFEFAETTIWGAGSAVLAACIVFLFARAIIKQRRIKATSDPDFVPGIRQVLLALSAPVLIILALNALGIVFDRGFAAYFLGLILLLVLCCTMFVLLLRFVRIAG